MMSKLNQILIMFSLVITGCSFRLDQNGINLSAPPQPESVTTPINTPRPALSPTVTPTLAKSQGKSIYSPLIFSEIESAGDGEVWVHHTESIEYTVFDLKNGTSRKIRSRPGCDAYLLPDTTQVLCDQEGVLTLYDLSIDVSESLNINTPDWVSSSSNGKYLILGHAEDFYTGPQMLQIIDLENRKIKYNKITIDVSDWFGGWGSQLPGSSLTLSPDGEKIALLRGSEKGEFLVSILDLNTNTYFDLDVGESQSHRSGSGLSWGPETNHLLYGSMDLIFDVAVYVSNLYLIDVETNMVTPLIIQAEEEITFHEFWSNHAWFPGWNSMIANSFLPQTWSPDGNRLLLIDSTNDKQDGDIWFQESLCFYELITNKFNCYETWNQKQSEKYHNLFNVAWSSSSEEVVFIAATRFPSGDLFIFNPNLDQFILLEENIQIDGVFWR